MSHLLLLPKLSVSYVKCSDSNKNYIMSFNIKMEIVLVRNALNQSKDTINYVDMCVRCDCYLTICTYKITRSIV